MRPAATLGAIAAICIGMGATAVLAQNAASRDFNVEIEEAIRGAKTAAAFEHLGTLNRLCVLPPMAGANTSNDLPGYIADPSTVPPRDRWYAEPAKVFDNLYFVGGKLHTSWALTTSEGIILIDTIYPYNSEELIIEGLRKVGLDPADIKYVVISHAHGDHIGGVEVVQNASGAQAVLGAADWDLVAQYPNRFVSMTPDASTGIRIDGPTDLKLGDTILHIFPTPGHTPGTLSYIFDVYDNGTPLTVAYSGGTAFNFQTDVPDPGIANLQTYMDSQITFAAAAAEAGATVLLSNHSEFDNAVNKNRMIAGRGDGPHPYVNGEDSVARYFQVMVGCTRAKQIGLESRATN
jgi:metallo-beta-lactamase class B